LYEPQIFGLLSHLQAITGFINYKTAEGLTFRSVDSYEWVLERRMENIGEIDISRITHQSISDYLLYLRTEYVPRRFSCEGANGESWLEQIGSSEADHAENEKVIIADLQKAYDG
jgi:hypothetical protein